MSERRQGLIVIVASLTLIAVSLVLSEGWRAGFSSVYLFEWTTCVEKGTGTSALARTLHSCREEVTLFRTKYVVAFLLLTLGLGVARYFALIGNPFEKLFSGKLFIPDPDK
jgi:hypothetical protein